MKSEGRSILVGIAAGIGIVVVLCLAMLAFLVFRQVGSQVDITVVPSLSESGVVVTGVTPLSPAQAVGIRRGTIILAVDDRPVDSRAALLDALERAGRGSRVTLQILRGNAPETVFVTLNDTLPLLGVTVADDVGAPADGGPPALITAVITDSPAAAAGLQQGDIITAINGVPVNSTGVVLRFLASAQPGEAVDLAVQRGESLLSVSVLLGARPDNSTAAYLGVSLPPAPEAP